MTVQPDLVSPADAFLAGGSAGDRFLRQEPVAPTPAVVDESHARAIALIAGTFIAWRLFFVERAKQEIPAPPRDPQAALDVLWTYRSPWWAQLMVPSIAEVMAEQGLTGDELRAVANDYVEKLGSYVHQTSAAAVVDGYKEQLRRGVNPTLAWMRAIEGYGLDSRRLRSWVAQQAEMTGVSDLVAPGAQRALDRALLLRADVLGQTEGWHARQVAKSVVWMAREAAGQMPEGAQKRWVTRQDELVCKICGPLNGKQVGLRDRFVLPNGERLWAPGVHPNCRCEIELVYPKLFIEKNMPGDPYDRDRDGQFARQESRQRKTTRPLPVKEREVDPIVDQLLAQITDTPVDVDPYAELDPYAGASDPYSGADPYGVDPYGADPYAIDPYAEGTNPYGPKVKGTGRRRRITIIVNGVPTEVDAEDMAPDQDNVLYIPVDEFMAMGGGNTSLLDEGQGVRVGVPIDFDAWARMAASASHGTSPEAFPAHIRLANDHPHKILHDLDAFYDYSDRMAEDSEDYRELFWNERDAVYTDIMQDPDAFVSDLSNEEVLEVFQDAGLTKHARDAYWGERGTDGLREDLVMAVNEETPAGLTDTQTEALAEAFNETVINNNERVQAASEAIDESFPGLMRVPEIFTFKDNDAQAVLTSMDNGAVRADVLGKYRVAAIQMHMINPRDRDGLNPRLRAWREVVLERLDDRRGGMTDAAV